MEILKKGPRIIGYRLRSGRTMFTGGQLEVGIHLSELSVSSGFDTPHPEVHPHTAFEYGIRDPWTAEDRAELADEMIAAWSRFKARP